MRQNPNGRQVGLRLLDSQRRRRFCDEYQAFNLWYVFGYVEIRIHPNLLFYIEGMAEREGFEPSRGLLPYALSRGAPSTTRPSLRNPIRREHDDTGVWEDRSKELPIFV